MNIGKGRTVVLVHIDLEENATGGGTGGTRAATLPADRIQGIVPGDGMNPVGVDTGGHGARRTGQEGFLLTPSVQGEFVFDGAEGQVQIEFIDAVLVRVGHGGAGATPSIKAAVQVHRCKGGAGITVHVHPESDSPGAGGPGAGIARTVTGGGKVEGTSDDDLTVGESKGGVGTGRPGDQGFLGGPTVDGEFVFKGVGDQGHGKFPNGIVVGIAHGRARSAPRIKAAIQKDPVDGSGSVVIGHIHPKQDRVGGLGLGRVAPSLD